ncbi:MAG: rod shape-determining protein [Gammaproteobacteria bacterium]|nr:MAG: rod shape-determining protein [Gammaproteobacteria bacterium]
MSPNKKDNMQYIGIDLGTSRSVVSASNGNRKWVESYVGWPKDFVAKKMLGKRVLFGSEALEHRLALNLSRPLQNGVLKEGTERDEAAVQELIGHLIELADVEPGKDICVAVGVPAEALKVNKIAIRNAISEYAKNLMVVSEPFSVAYGLGTLDNTMILDIGAGTVDFCIMHGTVPMEDDQRSILMAGDYVDEQLLKLLTEKHPEADFSLNMVRRFKEKHGFVGSSKRRVKVEAPVDGIFTEFDITEEMRRACESPMPAIVETVIDLIAGFDPEFQESVRKNIIIAGGGSQLSGLDTFLTEATKQFEPCKFTCIDDPLHAGADGALELAADMPEEFLEKL